MKQPFLYRAYRLLIESDVALPELLVANPCDAQPDVCIRRGNAGEPDDHGRRQVGPFAWCRQDELWLNIPGICRFLASNGRTIILDADPAADPDSVRLFLLGSVFGALLAQRGLLVLHGNAVRIGDHCMVCIGPSGAGKSTLAAGFMRRGYTVLADDVVPIDDEGRALPGFPRLKLWGECAAQLGLDTSTLRRVRPQLDKFNWPLHERFENEALPVRWIYLLKNHPGDEVQFSLISGLQRFITLRSNTYRIRFLGGSGPKAEHLRRCGQLARDVQVVEVSRPRKGFDLDGLIDSILADIQARA